jgi:hypothetical protein
MRDTKCVESVVCLLTVVVIVGESQNTTSWSVEFSRCDVFWAFPRYFIQFFPLPVLDYGRQR